MRILEIFSTYKKDLKLVLKQGWDEKVISGDFKGGFSTTK